MNNEKYVIFLSSTPNIDDWGNVYGYWAGKDYRCEGELFPVTDKSKGTRTKIYSSRKRAENALKAALSRGYAYVLNGRIERI